MKEDLPCDDPNVLPIHGESQAEGELTLEQVQPQVIRDDRIQINCGDLNILIEIYKIVLTNNSYPVASRGRQFAVKHRSAEWEGAVTAHCPAHALDWGHVALVSKTHDTCQ